MTISQALELDLIAAIRDFCHVDEAKASALLKDSKATAKTLGLPLADTLVHLGFVAAPL